MAFTGRERVNNAIGVACLFILLVTPFSAASQETTPLYSFAYAYVSVGLLVGTLIARMMRCRLRAASKLRVDAILAVCGLLATFVLAVPEYVAYFLPAESRVTTLILVRELFSTFVSLHHLLLVLAGALLCLALSELFPRASESDNNCLHIKRSTRRGGGLAFAMMTFSYLVGVCRPGVWLPFADLDYVLADLAFPGLAYGVALILCGIGIAINRKQDGIGSCDTAALLACFALGQLTWNVVARCSDTVACAETFCFVMLIAVVTMGVLLLFFVLFARKREFAASTNCGLGDGAEMKVDSEALLDGRMEEYGLAAREREAVSLLLLGLNSSESACKMGVHPSTVRNYLQRAYKKIGVKDSKELLEMIPRVPLEDSPSDSAGIASFGEEGGRWASAFVFSFVLIVALLFFPHALGVEGAFPCYAHDSALGFGLGVFSYGVISQLLARCLDETRLKGCACSSRGRIVRTVSIIALLVLTFAYALHVSAVLCVSVLLNGSAVALCCAAIAILLCSSVKQCVFLFDAKAWTLRDGARLFLIVACAAMVSCLSAQAWLFLILSAVFVFTASLWILLSGDCRQGDSVREATFEAELVIAGCALSAGFFAGFDWASDGDMLTRFVELFFAAGFVVLCVRRIVDDVGHFAAVVVAMCCILSFIFRCQMALVFALVCIFVIGMMREKAWSLDMSSAVGSISIGLGAGMIVGMVTANRLLDYVSAFGDLPIGSQWFAFTPQQSTPLLAIIFALIGLACLAWIAYVSNCGSLGEVVVELAEKRRLFMASQGVSEREIEVLELIVEGLTGPQIARKIHYSYGAVNVARASGYRKLGVHSKRELIDLLRGSV